MDAEFFLVVGGLLVLGIGSILFIRKVLLKPNPLHIVHFIKVNRGSNRAAASIHYNGESFAAINENQSMPLASTVKIMVAIEYARQASEGKLDPKESVAREELDPFYVPKTDGGAHQAWLHSLSSEEEPTLKDIAVGMIAYSSNANTEYLMNRLGLDRINQLISLLDLHTHDPLYPFVSALAIPNSIKEEKQLSREQMLQEMKNMDNTEYRARANQIHRQWLHTPLTHHEKQSMTKDLDMEVQQIWSDRLPGSTSSDYLTIMKKLNDKDFFDPAVYAELDPILEQLMVNPANQKWLKHAGQKAGSTAFVLTIAMYATDKEGNQTELVILTDQLQIKEQMKLSNSLNAFQLEFMKNEVFRNRVKDLIGGGN
ncbi:serine hydrolase [Alkalicoccobacillus murimartini]|uniref:D-alanyl-D-alanine carboxypeptidase n=1 Tax=Alkalicoccobacillus murimartini TaxID=171685 RepID=A0ABT9YIC8_9BACI|nr:serine hydrolase [Alkalicoccobacillus murimartini]MDQ0207444.1 D-alanyl-D-alanine carboxypeptidase [Alkalicoccobacillus murimartini]